MNKLWRGSTISLVMGIFLLGFGLSWAGPSSKATYVGAKKCKMCHFKQYKSWEKMKHFKSFEALSAADKGKEECVKCHVTGYGKPGGFKSLEKTPNMTEVQCEVCHGPGSEHLAVKMTDKAKKKATINGNPGAVCVKCHNPHKTHEEYKK